MADVFNIAGRIHSTSQEEVVTTTNEILDATQEKKQSEVNQEVSEELALHTNRLNALTGQNYVTVVATQSTTSADIPTLINASGEGEQADTLYRVGFWDGSAYVADKYTEYAWNGTAYVILDVKSSIGEVFDISQYNAVGGTLATYADLSAALDGGNNVPVGVRQGGMSIKFVQSSDNKYVQARCMAQNFTTDVTQWQGVDNVPTARSHNLVESGGVYGKVDINPINYLDLDGLNDGNIKSDGYTDNPASTVNKYTKYIKVAPETQYYASLNDDTGIAANTAYHAFYNENGQCIGSVTANTTQFTTPAGTVYARFTLRNEWANKDPMVNLGSARLDKYVPYSPIDGYLYNIKSYADEKVAEEGSVRASEDGKVLEKAKVSSVEIKNNQNLLSLDSKTDGRLNSDGNLVSSSNYCVTDFIAVKSSTDYCATKLDNSGFADVVDYSYHYFYDSNFNKISGGIDATTTQFTSPANAAYIRLSIYNQNLNAQLIFNEGTTRLSPYKKQNKLSGYLGEISESIAFVKNIVGFNKTQTQTLTPLSTENNKFVNWRGNINTGATTLCYDIVSVALLNSGTINISGYTNNPNVGFRFLDANENVILCGKQSASLEVPIGASVLEFTRRMDDSVVYILTIDVYPKDITPIDGTFINETPSGSLVGQPGISITAASLSNNTLIIDSVPRYLKKEYIVSACGYFTSGNFNSVKTGIGYLTTRGAYVEVTPSVVKTIFYYNSVENVLDEQQHGLTIDTFVNISVICNNGKLVYIVGTLGGYYRKEVSFNLNTLINDFYGYPFVHADNSTTLTDVKLSRCSHDFHYPVWIFGDSYMSTDSPARWTYYMLKEWGITNWLCCALAGQTSEGAYSDLVKALNFGTPKYLVWCLGMNDGVNETPYKTYLDLIIEICQSRNITLILQTIPSVPIANKSVINNIIKNSGYRYIDVYKAVGANDDGVWYDGYLENPGGTPSQRVHTTALGAKAQAERVLVDFPEIMQYGLQT